MEAEQLGELTYLWGHPLKLKIRKVQVLVPCSQCNVDSLFSFPD